MAVMKKSSKLKIFIVMQTKLIAHGTVLRSGRNLTVVSIEIRLQETKKLLYTAQVTFFHLPAAKL